MGEPIEAVTFDFWNTIATVPPGAMTDARQRAIGAACEASEVAIEAELLRSSLEGIGLHWDRAWAEGRHLPPREAAEMLVADLGLEGAAREMVAEAFLGAGRQVPLQLAPAIGECLEELARRGVRLGIVCDVGFSGGAVLRELLDQEGLLPYFHGWGFSDEVGHYKPSAPIFEAALAALGARPARALHVGDLRRTDVAGARALGMATARYLGFHDDPDGQAGLEADFLIESHRELPALVDRLALRSG